MYPGQQIAYPNHNIIISSTGDQLMTHYPHLPLTLVGRPVAKQKQEQESMQEQATEVSNCGRFKTVKLLIVDPLK